MMVIIELYRFIFRLSTTLSFAFLSAELSAVSVAHTQVQSGMAGLGEWYNGKGHLCTLIAALTVSAAGSTCITLFHSSCSSVFLFEILHMAKQTHHAGTHMKSVSGHGFDFKCRLGKQGLACFTSCMC